MANAVGAPRTVSPVPDDMIALGEEMVIWVELNKDSILHLSEWYTIHKMFTRKQWDTFKDRQEFIPYYERALAIIGKKYLDKNSQVRDGISQRWQRVYFKDLRDQEDADLNAAAERQKGIDGKHYTTINFVGDPNLGGKESLSPPELSNTPS